MKQSTLDEIGNKILEIERGLAGTELSLWKLIKITPEKWTAHSGDVWVVGVAGNKVIWYDEETKDFSISAYRITEVAELLSGKLAQSDVPDNMLALLTALHASQPK